MTYTSETELLLSQIDLHQLEESSVRSHQTEIAEHVKPEFKLVIDDGSNYRSYILTGDYYDIGRDLSCSITVSNQYISGHHATLRRVYDSSLASGFTYQLFDGQIEGKPSTNGVFVNEDKVRKQSLKSGDVIKLGPEVKAKFSKISLASERNARTISNFSLTSDLTSYSIIDPYVVTDIEGKIVDFNCAAESKLGYTCENVLGVQLLDLLFPDSWRESFRYILARFSLNQDSSILGRWNNVEVLVKDGSTFCAEVSLNCVKTPQSTYLTFSIRDITDNNLKKSQILHKIYEDPLTGLGNRRLFLKRLETIFSETQNGNGQKFALLYLDLDGFKTVNDTLGHNVGDELLIKVALRLKKCLREDDIIARLGGDEFTILLEGEEVADSVSRIAGRLSEFLNRPYTVSDQKVIVTASIGVLVSDDSYSSIDEILRDADFAMYSAKSSGKGTYVIFDSNLGEQTSQTLSLERDLCFALERDELFVEYQPIVSSGSGKIASFEALVRWKHPDLGRVSPMEFIPIAEKNGRIIEIGLWVLQSACEQLKAWQSCYEDASELSISVNLSIKQLEHPRIVEDIAAILEQVQLDPKYLKIEITETHLMNNVSDASLKLSQMKEMGIQIYIDDFGTGYSSLKYLNELSVNALKIDKSFVDKLEAGGSGLKLAQSIVYLARALEIQVIAEGVENSEQLSHLLSMDCDQVQGYFFAKPMNSEHAEAYLAERMGC